MQWDPEQPLDPQKLADFDALVHLAGKNIAGRWTQKFKREVLDSRVRSTQTLATAAAESYRRTGQPRVLSRGFGAGYYGNRGDEVLTEDSSPAQDFWRKSAGNGKRPPVRRAEAGVRVVKLRIGVVLARDGGALKPMLLPFRLGLGGRVGTGPV